MMIDQVKVVKPFERYNVARQESATSVKQDDARLSDRIANAQKRRMA